MLAADIAEVVLPHVQNDPAKSALVKMRASLPLSQSEVRRVLHRNALSDGVSVPTAKAFVSLKGNVVHVDLPANTAAVLASIGNTSEPFVISRSVKLHGLPLVCL
jgi:hypothetical protein